MSVWGITLAAFIWEDDREDAEMLAFMPPAPSLLVFKSCDIKHNCCVNRNPPMPGLSGPLKFYQNATSGNVFQSLMTSRILKNCSQVCCYPCGWWWLSIIKYYCICKHSNDKFNSITCKRLTLDVDIFIRIHKVLVQSVFQMFSCLVHKNFQLAGIQWIMFMLGKMFPNINNSKYIMKWAIQQRARKTCCLPNIPSYYPNFSSGKFGYHVALLLFI